MNKNNLNKTHKKINNKMSLNKKISLIGLVGCVGLALNSYDNRVNEMLGKETNLQSNILNLRELTQNNSISNYSNIDNTNFREKQGLEYEVIYNLKGSIKNENGNTFCEKHKDDGKLIIFNKEKFDKKIFIENIDFENNHIIFKEINTISDFKLFLKKEYINNNLDFSEIEKLFSNIKENNINGKIEYTVHCNEKISKNEEKIIELLELFFGQKFKIINE